MNEPQIADTSPIKITLVEGKRYFFCTCGKSDAQPFCDGSHKDSEFSPHMFEAEKNGDAWLCMCKRTKGRPFCDGSHKALSKAD